MQVALTVARCARLVLCLQCACNAGFIAPVLRQLRVPAAFGMLQILQKSCFSEILQYGRYVALPHAISHALPATAVPL
jgi:hypothetical protein